MNPQIIDTLLCKRKLQRVLSCTVPLQDSKWLRL